MPLYRHNRLKPKELHVDETLFATQNTYLGVRGNFEEGVPHPSSIRGTYINGFYDSNEIPYGEKAHGFPQWSQTIVNVPDAQTIRIVVEGVTLCLDECHLLDLKRTYDIDQGFTVREALYETPDKKRFKLTFRRMAHLKDPTLFAIDVTVESLHYNGTLTIESRLDGNVQNYVSKVDGRASGLHAHSLKDIKATVHPDYGVVSATTKTTLFDVTAMMTHSVAFAYETTLDGVKATQTFTVSPQMPISFTKYVHYFNTLDHDDHAQRVMQAYETTRHHTFEALMASQIDALSPFKAMTHIELSDVHHSDLNETVLYNLYQLYTAGGQSSRTNIAAKGLSGEGYEGHTFWDTEIYFIPFFMQIDPTRARNLLEYRYHGLDAARAEARMLGAEKGVKFPWRTINGREASAYYPAGTAQYHINCDIAYAVIQYYLLTQDDDFMVSMGWELLLETARFFTYMVHDDGTHYHMHHVTGPDEYTAVVDDNYYTNSLLQYQLEFILSHANAYPDCVLKDDEAAQFSDLAERIALPYDKTLGIDAQDASFLSKPQWPLDSIPQDKRPLLLHYHPLTIYRHQVIKQADTVLSHVLLHNRPLDVMARSFEYYRQRTTHDSSLSYCIHALQAARLGQVELAYDYFMKTVALDLDNAHQNTQHGLHMANMGGMYVALLYGFLGYRIDSAIHLAPVLPKAWTHLNIHLRLDATHTLEVRVTHDEVNLTPSKDVTVCLYGQDTALIQHKTFRVKAKK